MKKILIIGANWEQAPLLRKAKELGHYVIATNPYSQGEGFKYSDKSYVVNPRDLTQIDEIFRKTRPDGVIADECDYSMFTVAYLVNKYRLSGPSMDSLIITNNKYLQRKMGLRAAIMQPEFRLCMTYKEVKTAVKELDLPVMLKPLDNRGSIGVSRVIKKGDLEGAFFRTIANSHGRQMLVEKLVKGHVVTVEGLYLNRFINLSFSTKKMHPQYPDNAMFLRYPGNLRSKVIKKLYKINEKIVKACQINFGVTHSEFIVDGEKINFLEIANRGGGVHISNLIIPAITGIDVCKLLINSAMGKDFSLKGVSRKTRSNFALLHFFDFGKGKVIKIKNLNKATKLNGVLALRLNFKPGDFLADIKTAVNRPGFVIVVGKTLEECNLIISKIEETLKIEFFK